MLTRDRVAGVALLLFAAAVMWEDRAFPLGSVTKPGPGYMPMLLAAYVGRRPVTAALHPAFMDAAGTAFAIFAALCVIGTFASLARGKVR